MLLNVDMNSTPSIIKFLLTAGIVSILLAAAALIAAPLVILTNLFIWQGALIGIIVIVVAVSIAWANMRCKD
jgi:hypothetical protein